MWLVVPVGLRAIPVGKKGPVSDSKSMQQWLLWTETKARTKGRAIISKAHLWCLLPPSDSTPKGSAFPDGDKYSRNELVGTSLTTSLTLLELTTVLSHVQL